MKCTYVLNTATATSTVLSLYLNILICKIGGRGRGEKITAAILGRSYENYLMFFKSPETSEKGNLLFLFSCDHTIPTGIVYFSALGFNLFISHCALGFHTEQFPLAKTEGTIFPFWLHFNKRTG